jgi:hypothetical protein
LKLREKAERYFRERMYFTDSHYLLKILILLNIILRIFVRVTNEQTFKIAKKFAQFNSQSLINIDHGCQFIRTHILGGQKISNVKESIFKFPK